MLPDYSVDSTLTDIRLLLKAPSFSKDQALDLLLNLKMVAKETNHPRAGFFDAAFRSLKEKSATPDIQCMKYLEVILGDNDQEKVLDMMSKVDKSMRLSTLGFNRVPGRGRSHSFRSVQCYHCRRFGHYQSYCPDRRQAFGEAAGPPASRGKCVQDSLKNKYMTSWLLSDLVHIFFCIY